MTLDELQVNPTEVKAAALVLSEQAASVTSAQTSCDSLPRLADGFSSAAGITIGPDLEQFRTAWSGGLVELAGAITALSAKTQVGVELLVAVQVEAEQGWKSILNFFQGRS